MSALPSAPLLIAAKFHRPAAPRGLQADLLALQSFLAQAQGRAPEALALAEQARPLAPDDDVRLIASTALALGVACRMVGRFDEASEALEEARRLLAEGLTYAEIAARLVVSVNTVRFHVKEIYG